VRVGLRLRLRLSVRVGVAELHPHVTELAHHLGTQRQVGGQLRLRVVQRPLETGERLVGLAYNQVERGKADERAHERLRLVLLLEQLAQQHHALDCALRVAWLGLGLGLRA